MLNSAGTQLTAPPKINLPVSRGVDIPRPRMTRILASERFSAVIAPPGSGKTTLAVQWARDFPGAVLWMTLQPEDDRPGILHFVLQLVDLIEPGFSAGPAHALSLEGEDAGDRVVSSFIEAFAALPTPVAIVLDEVQNLTHPTLVRILAGIAARLPEPHRVVFVGRSLVPQLRDLACVVDDLSLSRDETAQYLAASMDGPVDSVLVQQVHEQTEGWMMGVKLAGLALRQRPMSPVTLASASYRTLMDLAVTAFPPPMLELLQQTCVSEWLTADLCAALSGMPDSASRLEELTEAGLFVTRFDGTPHTYRLHSLLRNALIDRLQQRDPDRLAELHRLAADWYGSRHQYFEAATQASLAGDIAFTAWCVLEVVKQHFLFEEMIWLRQWLSQFPSEILDAQPRLRLYALMAAVIVDKDPDAAQAHLVCLRDSPQADALSGEIALGRAYLAILPEGRTRANWQPHLEEALARLPDDPLRAHALLTAARLYDLEGEIERAFQAQESMLRIGRALQHREITLVSLSNLASHQFRQGRYDDVLDLTTQARAIVQSSPVVRVTLRDLVERGLSNLRAQVLFQRGLVAEAEAEVRSAIARPNLASPNLLQRVYCQYARILAWRNDWTGMDHFLEEALLLQGILESRGLHHQGLIDFRTLIGANRAQCTLRTMNPDAARQWLEIAPSLENVFLISLGLAHLTPFARLILGDVETARVELEVVERHYMQRQMQPQLWQISGLMALAYVLQGDDGAADLAVQETVNLTQLASDVVALALPPLAAVLRRRVLASWDEGQDLQAEHVRRVLESMGETAPSLPIRPFTRAERKVAGQIAQGNTVAVIADALHLAPNTVRYNIRNIHKKMLTHSREKLVERLQGSSYAK